MENQIVLRSVATVALPPFPKKQRVYYPSSDGEPMAETDWHAEPMIELRETLKDRFANRPDVYITGNIMFYYEKDNPKKSLSPDVMVVKGVANRKRRVFQLWKEQPPVAIFEISSRETKRKDFEEKLELYARFGVPEYYIFDPEAKDRRRAFAAFRLAGLTYQPADIVDGRIFSLELGLEIVHSGETLRLFDPTTQIFLPTRAEQQALIARQAAEIERLQAELARLRGK